MSSSDEETLSERSYRSERSCKSERSYRSERSGSLSPCPPGDTLPWNLPLHEQKKRKSQDSILDPAERAVVRVAGKENSSLPKFKQVVSEDERSTGSRVPLDSFSSPSDLVASSFLQWVLQILRMEVQKLGAFPGRLFEMSVES